MAAVTDPKWKPQCKTSKVQVSAVKAKDSAGQVSKAGPVNKVARLSKAEEDNGVKVNLVDSSEWAAVKPEEVVHQGVAVSHAVAADAGATVDRDR